ncbi:tyrosine phosphatase family protein [Hirsutella rhossiliensis]|uniref:Tyrosine phosphatase family domain-containing protein n=1 Tax=Hirsutella rhossiliensis TaxID=111463 RepID=A0A9P8N0V0_9HYPO|nr:tyrosine phosphatase family domain-containing protein [Hirsutella rhossiliensis]KAH0964840.1 tyrosine phosphatase family domain-containing protein [Hirsutella rhossiliensis]
MDQSVQLRQVPNFRDVGLTVNRFLGRKLVREGLFYRSARPEQTDAACPEDRALLRDRLGIKTIIDLRTDTELRQQAKKQQQQRPDLYSPPASSSSWAKVPAPTWSSSSPRIEGIGYLPVNIIGRPVERYLMSQLTWWAFIKTICLFLLGYRLHVTRIMASEVLVPIGLLGLGKAALDHAGAEIRQVLSLYTHPQATPALVHCTLGKDRTGLVCTLILLILGVPVAAIEHDYFLTDDALVSDRAERLVEVRNAGFSDEWAGTADNMIVGTESHLATKYGGLDAYLDHIGFGGYERAKLRKALLY